MENSVSSGIHKATTWSIVLSVLMIAAGSVALFLPKMTGVAATLVLGSLLIIGAIVHLGFAWRAGQPAAVVWEILIAVLYGATGAFLLAKPSLGLEALTMALAIYLVLGGTLELAVAFALRPLPGSGWLLLDGIVFLVLAALIWRGWPATSTWVVGTLVAISLFVSGLSRLMLTLAVRRVLR